MRRRRLSNRGLFFVDLEDSGSYVFQDGQLFREEPDGTYTPVDRVRK